MNTENPGPGFCSVRDFLFGASLHLYPARRRAAVESESHFYRPLTTGGKQRAERKISARHKIVLWQMALRPLQIYYTPVAGDCKLGIVDKNMGEVLAGFLIFHFFLGLIYFFVFHTDTGFSDFLTRNPVFRYRFFICKAGFSISKTQKETQIFRASK